MHDTKTITIGKELLEIAIEFQSIAISINDIRDKFNAKAEMMSEESFYNGRNRDNINLANHAATAHIANLADYYSMCYVYILNAYKSMIEFDESLARAIEQAYIGDINEKK